jgi:CheY-like chemotaxis protein
MNKCRILVVDDEHEVLAVMKDLLEIRGYAVTTSDNGAKAITIAQTKQPDVIICDISMPHVDGGQVAQALKDDPRTSHIPIIFLTGLLARGNEENKKHLVGGNVMFAKPCDFDELTAQIEKMLLASSTKH